MTTPDNPQPERSWGPAGPAPHDEAPLPDEPPYDPEYDEPGYHPVPPVEDRVEQPATLDQAAGAGEDEPVEQSVQAFEEHPLSAEAQEPLVAAALEAQQPGEAQPGIHVLAEEQAPAEEPAAAVPAGGRRFGLLVGAVAVLAVLGVVLGALLVARNVGGSLQDDREGALDAARAGARAVFSYDYRHLDKDFAGGRAATTGKFRTEYERTTGKIIKDVAPRYKGVQVADVSDVGVVRATPGRVVVLAFLDAQSTSSLINGSKLTQNRVEMTMVKKNGRWLIEDIRAF